MRTSKKRRISLATKDKPAEFILYIYIYCPKSVPCLERGSAVIILASWFALHSVIHDCAM